MEETPQYLYKILSISDWEKTQNQSTVALPIEDEAFIHFSKEDQLEKILNKYWSKIDQFVVLKIESQKLQGHLVYETNPGGLVKYYHLYEGSIPVSSIIETKIVGQ